MAQVVVPGSWHNVIGGRARFDLPAGDLGELLRALVDAHPEAGYRLYSPAGELMRYHIFFVDGEQVCRRTAVGDVKLGPASVVEIVPPLAGG